MVAIKSICVGFFSLLSIGSIFSLADPSASDFYLSAIEALLQPPGLTTDADWDSLKEGANDRTTTTTTTTVTTLMTTSPYTDDDDDELIPCNGFLDKFHNFLSKLFSGHSMCENLPEVTQGSVAFLSPSDVESPTNSPGTESVDQSSDENESPSGTATKRQTEKASREATQVLTDEEKAYLLHLLESLS